MATISKAVSTNTLHAAQWAFANRCGLQAIQPNTLITAFSHPVLPLSEYKLQHRTDGFLKLADSGLQVIQLFTSEYFKCRFPALSKDSIKYARDIFCADQNLAVIARSIGLVHAITPYQGIPQIVMPQLQHLINARPPPKAGRNQRGIFGAESLLRNSFEGIVASDQKSPCSAKPTSVLASIVHALLGALLEEGGALECRTWLDNYLLKSLFPITSLVRPQRPMVTLARVMRNEKRSMPTYRLLAESGRLSNSSVYCVGVYVDELKLAESYGPSLYVARERAAVLALRSLFLKENASTVRPSDCLEKMDLITKASLLQKIVNPN